MIEPGTYVYNPDFACLERMVVGRQTRIEPIRAPSFDIEQFLLSSTIYLDTETGLLVQQVYSLSGRTIAEPYGVRVGVRPVLSPHEKYPTRLDNLRRLTPLEVLAHAAVQEERHDQEDT